MNTQSPAVVCKLGDDACNLLNRVLQSCNDWSCVLDALAKIPVDVTAQHAEFAAQKHLAETLKSTFFPHMP